MNNSNTIILAIETATSSCSVALSYAGQVFTRHQIGNNIHSAVLLEMVSGVLDDAKIQASQIQAVAVGQGPGSFTGLRIGIGVAQGIAYGINAPMIGVSSLDALANQAPEGGPVVAGIDARMGEVYWCEYLKNSCGVQRIGDLKVSPPGEISNDNVSEKIQLVGNAWQEYQGELSSSFVSKSIVIDTQIYPVAESLLVLSINAFQCGQLINAKDFAPEYVRNNVAKKSTKNRIKAG